MQEFKTQFNTHKPLQFMRCSLLILIVTISSSSLAYSQTGNSHTDPFIINSFNQTYTGTTSGFTEVLPMGPSNSIRDEPNVWYKFVYPANTEYLKIEYTPENGIGSLVLYDQEGIDLWNNSNQDQPLSAINTGTQGATATIPTESLIAGETYYFTVFKYYNGSNYTINLSTTYTLGDSHKNPFIINSLNDSFSGTTSGINEVLPMGPNNHESANEPNAWYKFVYPENTDYLKIEYTPENGIGSLVLYDQEGIDLWNNSNQDQPLSAINTGTQGATATISTESLIAGETYYFTVFKYYNGSNYTINLSTTYTLGDSHKNPFIIDLKNSCGSNMSISGTTKGLNEAFPMGSSNHTNANEPNAWYKFIYPENTESLKIQYTPGNGLGRLLLYNQEGIDKWNSSNQDQPLLNTSSGTHGGTSTIDTEILIAGETYYFTVYKYYGGINYTINLTLGGGHSLWNSNDQVVYTNCSKVGIGTNEVPEDYALAIDGKAIMEGVKVQLSEEWQWPDYVFDENYKIKSISDLEKFISINKHLPEIPSQLDVQNNGIDLGEMDAKLLRKIEELTLYLIEQNKKLELQNNQLQIQGKKIEELKKALAEPQVKK